MATVISSLPANAGSWVFTCTGSGSGIINYANGTSNTTPWVPPAAQTGSFGLGSTITASSYFASSCKSTVTVTVTATWTHGTGQNDTNDPAPPSVWLCESGSAHWTGAQASGSASDGLGPEYKLTPSGNNFGGTASTSDAPVTVPPAYWTKYPVSGGVVTLPTRTLKAEADYTVSPLGGYCLASIDTYSVTVHAQPFNFHQLGSTIDNGQGTLAWNYVWNSTDGTLSDILPSCTVYEFVSYDNNTTGTYVTGPPPSYTQGYIPPSPPIAPDQNGVLHGYVNPTITPVPNAPGSAGAMNDTQYPPPNFAPTISQVAATWTALQTYYLNDSATGEVAVIVPGPGSGPMTITRTVYVTGPPTAWYYTVNKSGTTSTPYQIRP